MEHQSDETARRYANALFEIGVENDVVETFQEHLEAVVEAIRDAAHTGEKGDGKIFVLPVEGATQIRTANEGTEAV